MIVHRIQFRLRHSSIAAWWRKAGWVLLGARFGHGTRISNLTITWPHQVHVGEQCVLEDNIYFKFDGIWRPGPSIIIRNRIFIGRGCEFNIRQTVDIGDDCLIASGCKFIDHDHGIEFGQPMNRQFGSEIPISLAEDVWLGCNVIILKGVTIGKGAIVGAGAVVTKSIPAGEIWGGVPARKIGLRPQNSRTLQDVVAVQ